MFKKITITAGLSALGIVFALSSPATAADAEAGKKLFRQCAACHALDGKNRAGPHLNDIVGRPVAALEDFKYSRAMTTFGEDGKIWDEPLLTEYLAAPRKVVKGTTMVFAGLKKPNDIVDLIEFLKGHAADD